MSTERIGILKDRHKGQTCWIIGTGPSIDRLKSGDIGLGPVIAVHRAWMKVKTLALPNLVYSMQKDRAEAEIPTTLPVILHEHESRDAFPDSENRYIFDNPVDFDLPWNAFSMISAIEIARLMGCSDAVLMCCDSHLSADRRTWPDTSMSAPYSQRQGIDFHLSERPFPVRWFIPLSEPASIKLMIATPFYMMAGSSPYIKSLFGISQILAGAGVPCTFLPHDGDSYVDRARNTICAKFLDSDCTDLLMIDSDMDYPPDAIVQILKSPYEVTAGVYPMKNNWGEYPVNIYTDEDGTPKGDLKTGLISAKWVTAGFLRIRRSALEKMRNSYAGDVYFDPSADPQCPTRPFVPYFRLKLGIGGEDQTFCEQWRTIGGEIWVEPRITFGHYGIHGTRGNYDQFLRSCPGGENASPDDCTAPAPPSAVQSIAVSPVASAGEPHP